MKNLMLAFALSLLSCSAFGQVLRGYVLDDISKEALPGVSIQTIGVVQETDVNGFFEIDLSPGIHVVTFRYVGYDSVTITASIESGRISMVDIHLRTRLSELDAVVVSGSLFAKRQSEESISMMVVPSAVLQQTNATNLSDAMLKAPGVYMMDEQANIRGGTGFTYGAGSRVMLVVDDQVMLAADRGDAKWNFVPMEHVDQIEVIKGASSVLYGSSALNGVIAVRTVWPGMQPETHITAYHTLFDKPALEPAAWWDHAPAQTGINFSHRQKFDHMDLVVGGNIAEHDSYLLGQYSSRARLNWKTRFHPGHNSRLTWGVNGNVMSDREGLFFLWEDNDSGGYIPFQGYLDTTTSTLLNWQYKWATIDPWLTYYDRNKNSHKFKMRYYGSNVVYSDTTGGDAWLANLDYQYHRLFAYDVTMTAGGQGYYFDVDDHDVGVHDGISAGLFVQVEKKLFDRLLLNVGMREEFYKLDTAAGAAVPIFKAGMNYTFNPLAHFRASFGQGYRFPSLVERFARSNLGSLSIFPNPDLLPEYGWNTEIGFMRSFNGERFRGYADIAFYVTEYFDMTEFTFNFYEGLGPGFMSLNNSRARIGGMEFTVKGEGDVFGHTLSWIGGYNYIYPANISGDSSNLDFGTFMGNFMEGFTAGSSDTAFLASVLTYRFRHMARMNLQYTVKKWSFGADVNYFSLMENLDAIYISFIPGIVEYREDHMNGDWIFDARAGYQLNSRLHLQILAKNILNNMYALRPAKYDPPRSYTVQMRIVI